MATLGDERPLITRLEAITHRLTDLEVQVRALVESHDRGGENICSAR